MKIILRQDHDKLGKIGDIVEVKDGYARNFLIPQGKAKRATEAAKAEFEARRAELEKKAAEAHASAAARGEKLEGYLVQVTQKAGAKR